jgi:hypothetical protein
MVALWRDAARPRLRCTPHHGGGSDGGARGASARIEQRAVRHAQAQKFSVQKQLRRRFQRFIAEQGDFNSLLLTVLRGMVREAHRTAAMAAGGAVEPSATVLVDRGRFEERAAEYAITNVEPFYSSAMFADQHFSLSDDGTSIVLAQ